MESSNFSSTYLEGELVAILTVVIDLAKNVFAMHFIDKSCEAVLIRPNVKRTGLLEPIAKSQLLMTNPACRIRSTAHSAQRHQGGAVGHRPTRGTAAKLSAPSA